MPMPQSRTVPALVDELALRYPDRAALVAGASRYDYRSLQAHVRGVARGLMSLGVTRGSRVAILMGNRAEWVVADLAAASLGAVVVAVNTWLTTRELAYVLDHSDADTLVLTTRFLKHDYTSMLDDILSKPGALPKLKRIVHVGGSPYRDSIAFADLPRMGDQVSEDALDRAAAAVVAEDVACLIYTSGSASTPKGVQVQHAGLIENMWQIGERMHVTPDDRLWLAVSLFWGFGCENALFNALTHGACLVLQEHFDAGEALRLIERERCTLFYGTSNIAHALATHPDRARHDLSSLRSGGSLGTVEQLQRVVDLGAHEICNIYGLTEVYGNCNVVDCRRDPPDKRFTSVGRPLLGFEQRVVDPETQVELAAGEIGEIQVRGHVTLGYYKDEVRTRAAFTPDGYFRTGDLGYVDEDGFLFFRGRLKEMIKTGGINVSPAEVEEVLMGHSDVALAFAIGLPDPTREEIIAAVVVPRSKDLREDILLAACRQQLATYKVPQRFCFVAEKELPLTTTGKVHRDRLPELFAAATESRSRPPEPERATP